MEKKQRKQHARSRSFTFAGGSLATFFRSTVASFSSTFPTSRGSGNGNGNGGRSSFNHRNAFSGPIVSIVPPEARGGGGGRRSSKRWSGYRTPEPSSPKVSCIGQIKRSNSRRQKKVNPSSSCGKNGGACPLPPRPSASAAEESSNKPWRPKPSLVQRMSFFRRSRSRRFSRQSRTSSKRSDGAAAPAPAPAPAPAGLGQMKRFASGRAAFQDFDWREQEEERRSRWSDEEEEDEGFVAHSAPLVLGGGVVAAEPRKEVNLWRRRPMAPPTPLQLP